MSTTNVVSSDPHCGPGNYHPARVYLNRKHFSLARTKAADDQSRQDPIRLPSGWKNGGKMLRQCFFSRPA